jgi:hypothetical protein
VRLLRADPNSLDPASGGGSPFIPDIEAILAGMIGCTLDPGDEPRS